jgi:hypothetical protein
MSVLAWRPGIIALVPLILACTGGGSADQPADSPVAAAPGGIDGAWRVTRVKLADVAAVADPASVIMFAGRHYSIMFATETRTPFAKASEPTQAETLRAYAGFIANSGTYELAGDTIIAHPVIARNPSFMGGGQDRYVFRISGDTMMLHTVAGAFRWADGQPATTAASDSFALVRTR